MFVRFATQPAEHFSHGDATLELLEMGFAVKGGPGKVEIGIDYPVTARFGRPPVVVFEQVAEAFSGALALAVPYGINRDEDRPGRRNGRFGQLHTAQVAHVVGLAAHKVRTGDYLGRSRLLRRVLWVIEHLQVVQPWGINRPAVAVPPLGQRRALGTVIKCLDKIKFILFSAMLRS